MDRHPRRLRRRVALVAAATALTLASTACGLVGRSEPATAQAVAGSATTDPGATVAGDGAAAGTRSSRGVGSRLSRGGSDAASDLERQIARTLSDLNAETRGADTVVRIPDTVLFDFDQHELRPEATGTLDRLAEAIIGLDAPVRVDGHTDTRGEDAYNQALSERRAQSVATHLVAAGVGPDRITAQGLGETRPVAPNANPDGSDNPGGRAQNRRVEVTLVGVDLAELGE